MVSLITLNIMTEIEVLNAKIAEMKAAQAAAILELNAQMAEIEAKKKAMELEIKRAKAEAANGAEREKMAKFAALVAAGKVELKENKKETVLWCMMQGYCKEAILAYTGYTVKEVTDITWQIFESYGCNPNR